MKGSNEFLFSHGFKTKGNSCKVIKLQHHRDRADKHGNCFLDLGLGAWIENVQSVFKRKYKE